MPELPEVETTLRGISPYILHQNIISVTVRNPALRWPVPANLKKTLTGIKFQNATRRAKYLLLTTASGTLIIHLGMSGSLRLVSPDTAYEKHDHVEICFANGRCLRLKDPRRFGAVLWTGVDPMEHELLKDLGPEPLSEIFTGDFLFNKTRGRKSTIKQFIMDSHHVVGVGNIYASEALFLARIRPGKSAQRLTRKSCAELVEAIKSVLTKAIGEGGTSLRDFIQSDGRPGYFSQHLNVYGRSGEPCLYCGTAIKSRTIGQRATYYCPACQQ